MSAGYIPVKADDWAKMVEATKVAADLMVENKRLAAENERLRKAGDAVHRAIKVSDPALDWAIECWLVAKEGGAK